MYNTKLREISMRRADKSDCSTPRNDIAAVHNVLYIAEYFV